MLSLTRSRAGTLGWGLMLLSLLPGGRAFVFRAHSLNRLRMAPKQHHESQVNQNEGPSWVRGLSPALTVRGGGGNVKQVATQAELEEILANSGDALVCIDFTATWCSPCQQIAPAFEKLSQELTDVVFLKVDVDDNEETPQKYDVFQMPTFLFMRRGEVVDQFSGANPAVLRQKVESLARSQGGEAATVDAEVAAEDADGDAAEGADEVGEGAEESVEGNSQDLEGQCEPEANSAEDGAGAALAEDEPTDSAS